MYENIPHFVQYNNQNCIVFSIEHNAFIKRSILSLTFDQDSKVITFQSESFCGCHIQKLLIPTSLQKIAAETFF